MLGTSEGGSAGAQCFREVSDAEAWGEPSGCRLEPWDLAPHEFRGETGREPKLLTEDKSPAVFPGRAENSSP